MRDAGYPREKRPVLSPDAIENLYTKHKERLLLFFEFYNYEAAKLPQREMPQDIMQRYQTSLSFLGCYVYRRYKRDDFAIQHVNYEFIRGFKNFLKAEMVGNAVVDYCEECLMKVLRIALAGGLTSYKSLPN